MNSNPEEKWSKIKDHEDYKISNFGNVYSTKTNKLMSCNSIRSGYRSVCFNKNNKSHSYKIHRLVALHFIPNNDQTKDNVNHKDGNKFNNHIDNLEWTTTGENTSHGYETGLNRLTTRRVHQLDMDGNIIATFDSLKDAATQSGISDAGIVKVCRGSRQTAGEYKWCYADINPNDCVINLEHFVVVNDFPSYRISTDGIVYNPKFKKILKQQINADGYKVISLANNNVKKTFLVHRLVALHFIPNDNELKDQVNHKDGNKLNPDVKNLEWVTGSENMFHANELKKKTK